LRGKKKTIVIAVGIGIGSALVAGAIVGVMFDKKIKSQNTNFQIILQDKNNQIEKFTLASKQGYVLVTEKKAGDVIAKEDVVLSALPDYFAPTDIIVSEKEVVGKIIKIDSQRNTALTSNMVYAEGKLDDTLRKIELDYLRLPYTLKQSDVIDVRIIFPNGEDYYVLTRKKMTGLDMNNQIVFMNNNIEEILLMDSALKDAHKHKAEIYVTQFVEGEMQPKLSANYVPNLDVLRQIQSDPRIENKTRYQSADLSRKSLDERMDAIPDNEKIRLGAELPTGSAVASRRKTVGASVVVVDSGTSVTPTNPVTPPGQEQGIVPETQTPPPVEPEIPSGETPDDSTPDGGMDQNQTESEGPTIGAE
jgi:predicted RNA-binding protein